MIDRRLVQHFDWFLLLLALVLCGMGLVNLYSATIRSGGLDVFYKQLTWVGIGFAVMAFTLFFHYHLLERYAVPIYVCTLVLLILILLIGTPIGGSRRWLILGPLSFQPSEPAKLALIVVLSRLFYRRSLVENLGFKDLVAPAALMFLPAFLILKEPDLGTALLICFVGLSVLMFVRVRWQVLCAGLLAVASLAPLFWQTLKGYQKQRILTFFNPDIDPLGAGYHIIQSKIAVGSGRVTGKGFLASTQSHLNFLPEHHTDFAFSVLAEEWGFAGALLVIGVYVALVLWGLNIGRRSKDLFGALLAVGISAMLFWPAVINIAMVTGLLPVVGIPLPLISYGGSSAVSTLLAVALLMNISMRRYMFR